ncbi:amino acid adenylation domain-containing protein [Streptosporangium sp. NPDC000396]|uniref:non-ribosomal peptide synthetase n=1 Tax=Streptosporangium sp. NPDC000396 TaxID=3366185 RepID=UPI0036A910F3
MTHVVDEAPGHLLTWAQQDIRSQVREDPSRYLRQDRYLLEGTMDAEAFDGEWSRITTRHEALRTSGGIPVRWLDLRDTAEDERDRLLGEVLAEQRSAATNLTDGPAMTVAIARLGERVHQLCLTYHQMRVDAWSADLVLHEVLASHAGLALPEPVSPRAFLEWAKQVDLDEAGRYWRDRLAGFDTPTEPRLITTRVPGNGTGTVSCAVPAALSARLRELPPEDRSVLVEAAWALLLGLYAGSRDVVFGAARSLRDVGEPGAFATVGSLASTVPVRTNLDQDRCLGDWLGDLSKQRVAELPAPLDHIHRCGEVAPPRRLFDSVVEFVDAPASEFSAAELGFDVSRLGSTVSTEYPLGLCLRGGSNLLGELRYQREFVAEEAAEQLARLFVHLLDVLADKNNHSRPLGSLDLLDENERRMLVERYNDTAADYDRGRTVVHAFADQVAAQPDAVAVRDGKLTLTYAELDRKASGLAALLVERGVGPEQRVGICLDRSAALVVAMLAVLKAGGCYLPLDPAYPAARLRLMLGDAQARVVLTDRGAAAQLRSALEQPVMALAEDGTAEAQPETSRVNTEVHRETTAYVIYTSGSTGNPKGVVVQHSALSWFVGNADYLALGPDDVVALASSPSFDAMIFECWMALTYGAQLTVVPKDTLLSPGQLGGVLRDGGVTVMYVTAPLFEQLSAEAPGFARGLRVLFFGGQQVDPAAVSRVREHCPEVRLVQEYGPTETTVWNSLQPISELSTLDMIPLGPPVESSTEYLLDARLRPVPRGVPGEIYIGGDGVTRGYLNRPALTAERFLANPFGPGRLYRTGDVARFRADGALEFLGRVDDQVKIRGVRIETGEIEAALREHRDIRTALVMAREIADDTLLVAYFVPEPGAGVPAPGDLRRYLTDRLPGYMIPAVLIPLGRIPLAPNGKLDRKALPLPLTPEGRLDRRKLALMAKGSRG